MKNVYKESHLSKGEDAKVYLLLLHIYLIYILTKYIIQYIICLNKTYERVMK